MSQILRVSAIRNEQTKQTHRFTLRFKGLNRVLDRAKNSPLEAVRNRYNALAPAFEKPGWTVEQTLELGLLSVQVPNVMIAYEDVHRFNDSHKQLTKFEPTDEMSVVFYDYINGSASAIIGAWWALCGEKNTGAIGYKEDYVLPEASFIAFGPQAPAEDNPIKHDEYAIVNLAPRSVDLGEHSYENGAVRRVTCNFLFDNIYPVQAVTRTGGGT